LSRTVITVFATGVSSSFSDLYSGRLVKFGIPDECVSRWKIVMASHAAGASGTYFLTGSSSFNFPRSSSSRIDAAVNCLVIEPSRNFVAGVFGISHSRFADP
jgi:hypothetical protein